MSDLGQKGGSINHSALGIFGSGGRIRTGDLLVMGQPR
jgi:hypothetical protein